MLDQNYIKVFQNLAGEITIAYATNGANNLEVGDVQHVAIKVEDAYIIANELRELANDILNEE